MPVSVTVMPKKRGRKPTKKTELSVRHQAAQQGINLLLGLAALAVRASTSHKEIAKNLDKKAQKALINVTKLNELVNQRIAEANRSRATSKRKITAKKTQSAKALPSKAAKAPKSETQKETKKMDQPETAEAAKPKRKYTKRAVKKA